MGRDYTTIVVNNLSTSAKKPRPIHFNFSTNAKSLLDAGVLKTNPMQSAIGTTFLNASREIRVDPGASTSRDKPIHKQQHSNSADQKHR
jgi:hypothetical protein